MLGERYQQAFSLALALHATQFRKGTKIPYISHLLAVSSIVIEHGGDEDEAIAGLLHDAVEDQGGAETLRLIREQFGDQVAAIVDACSDTDVVPKPPWRARKEAYIAHVSGAPASVRLVSAADKLHNARSILTDLRAIGDDLWPRFSGGREGTLWYYRSLVEAFRAAGTSALVEELHSVVSEIEAISAQAPGRQI